jgi:hypothetical protein
MHGSLFVDSFLLWRGHPAGIFVCVSRIMMLDLVSIPFSIY